MKVLKPFERRSDVKYTVAANKTSPKFIETVKYVDNKPIRTIKVAGETDFYQKIQENRLGTDIYDVLDRYNKGDVEAIGENIGNFVDVVGFPNSLQAMEQVRIDAEYAFNSLPLDVRRKYGHDIGAFLADVEEQGKLAKQQQAEQKRQEVQQQISQEVPKQ